MKVNLSRQDLYDLVWSKPMIHVAKQFDISGVMLAKICNERNIPRPPRGYWMRLQSSKKRGMCVQTPLPNMLDKESQINGFNRFLEDEVVRRNAQRPEDFDPSDLDQPIPDPPAEFAESLKAFRNRLDENFPVLIDESEIKMWHPTCQTVLEADLVIAKIRKRDQYAADPHYQSEKGKLTLHAMNCVLHWFEALGFTVRLTGKKNFCFHVAINKHWEEFRVFLIDHDPSLVARKRFKERKRTTFGFSWVNQSEDVTPGRRYYESEKLSPDLVKAVVLDRAVHLEREFRERVFRTYENRVESRRYAIRRKAELEQRAIEKKRKDLADLFANRENLMAKAVSNMNQADMIRCLINAVKEKAASSKTSISGLDRWTGWATHQANLIDPRHMSVDGIEAWIKKFRFSD
jgi:hypothetical protein